MQTHLCHSNLCVNGAILWGNSTDVDLLVLQKKCIRILTNIEPRESCRQHFTRQKNLTLPNIYIYELCKFIRKNHNLYRTKNEIPRRYQSRRPNDIIQIASKLQLHSSGPYPMFVKVYKNYQKI